MGGLSGLAVLLAAISAALACGPRPGSVRLRAIGAASAPSGGASRHPAPSRPGIPPRRRAMAAGLAGAAGLAIVGGPAGWPAGAIVGVAAWVGLGRLEPAAVRRRRLQVAAALPLATELLAAAMSSGSPPERAVDAVGRAVGGPLGEALRAAVAAMRYGADPATAWAGLLTDPAARPLGRAMVRVVVRGAPAATALERVAKDARDAARWAAEAQGRSLGARAAAPLGLCFLPAFVLIGIVPLVATIGMPLLP